MARLRVLRNGKEVGSAELGDTDVRLGRAPENHVVLEDSGTSVSRYHAELRLVGDLPVLVNLSQPFGVWTAGQRVERVVMAPGVEAAVGPFTLSVEPPAAPAAVPALLPGVSPDHGLGMRPSPAASAEASASIAAASSPTPIALHEKPAGELSTESRAPAAEVSKSSPPTSSGSAVVNWLVFGAVAAGLVAVVALAQLISPATLTRPESVEAASSAPVGPTPTDDALRAQLSGAREAIERGQSDEALRELNSLLSKTPAHAEALALKAKAEEALAAAKPAVAPAEPSTTAHNAPASAAAAAPVAGGRADAARSGSPARASAGASPTSAAASTTKPLLQRPGTRDPAFAGRNADVVRRFLQAEAAYKDGQYRLALSNLQSVLRSDATFPTAEAKLEEVKSTVRGMAEAAFAEGGRLEKAGDFAGAIRSYQKSQEIATMMYGVMTGAEEAIVRARESAASTGVEAFKKARQYDALGRSSDAVAAYARAVEYLPADDPNRQLAQERLGVLKR